MFLLLSALFVAVWAGATYVVHFVLPDSYTISHILFRHHDVYVLAAAPPFLALLAWPRFSARGLPGGPSPALTWLAILLALLVAWAGHYLVFGGYSLTRDEQMAEFATWYLREGRLGMAVPPQWRDYVRGINPIFMSALGGDVAWISFYLPVHSAFRALVSLVADPDLTSPLFLAIGYASLWHVARRLFPARPDAVLVTMLLAFSSAQLLVMAMTAYAMTAHFALNLLWLALFLRDDRRGHAGAVAVGFLAVGLHQLQFHLLFAAPFIFWLTVRRRWRLAALYGAAYLLIVLFWGRVYPAILHDIYQVRPLRGGKPVGLLLRLRILIFSRLGSDLLPLFSLSRFMAWNNPLLAPLAALGASRLRWRGLFARDADILLPLALCCAIGLSLMVYQAHGWGYRYLHGLIGPFCLLAGFGWVRLCPPERPLSLRPIWLGVGFALLSGAFLALRAHDFVRPYARAYHMAKSVDADVVLVDTRGGVFIQDIVRVDDGRLTRPILMDLGFVGDRGLDALCRRYRIGIIDRRQFLPLGVPLAKMGGADDPRAVRRRHLAAIGCGQGPLAFTRSDWR